jgi:hypothetical protein
MGEFDVLRALVMGGTVGLGAVGVIRIANRRGWPKWQEFGVMAGVIVSLVVFWNLVWPEGA